MAEEIKKMTDEEATPFDWWLLNYLKEQLFQPELNDKRTVSRPGTSPEGHQAGALQSKL